MRRQWRKERARFEEGPRFSGAKRTETGWVNGVFLLHRAGIKFPERVSLCGQLFKIHWDSSSFV